MASKSHKKDLRSFFTETILENKKWAGATFGTMFGVGALMSAFPLLSGAVVTALQSAIAIPPMVALGTALVWATALPMLENVASFTSSLSCSFNRLFYQKLYNKVVQKSMEQTISMPALAQQQKTEKKLSDLKNRLAQHASGVLENSAVVVLRSATWGISTAALAYLYWPLAVGSTVMTGIKSWVSVIMSKKLKALQDELQVKRNQYQAMERDIQANARTIKAMGRQEEMTAQVTKRNNELVELEKKLEFRHKKIEAFGTGLDVLMSLGVTIPSVYLLLNNGNLGAFLALTGSAYRSLYSGTGAVQGVVQTHAAYQDYEATSKQFEYDRSLDPRVGQRELNNVKGHIQFREVDFKYPDTEAVRDGQAVVDKGPQIFKGFNLTIEPGERVAIIGPSGMGKSTLVSLLSHEYEIQGGSVRIDGENVQDVTAESVYKNVHFLAQEPTFFEHENIEYNLRFYRPDATKDEITQALKKAKLHDELMAKESGLEGHTTELSPGQRQRLALACAFLKDSPILILDEPTSKLDVESQKAVLESVRQFGTDKTVVFVSHVPAEIATASRVLVMDKGKVIEDGTPADLIHNHDSEFRRRYLDYKRLFDARKAEEVKPLSSMGDTLKASSKPPATPPVQTSVAGIAWMNRFGQNGH